MPIVYLDRDLSKVFDDTYGVTITTVLVKPKSRGYVELRSADPDDMPLVSPHLLKDPDDMATMIAGQRFFREVLLTGPLGKRVEKVIAPAGPDLSDEAMAAHCRRFVKTNYHPASTARMGADGDRMAVLDARMRVRGIDNLRVADMSAVPNINAGNTNAPAMMLGDRCADFILGLDTPRAVSRPTAGSSRMIFDRFRLDGQVALVTGATRGIGLGIAAGLRRGRRARDHVLACAEARRRRAPEGRRPQDRLPAGRRAASPERAGQARRRCDRDHRPARHPRQQRRRRPARRDACLHRRELPPGDGHQPQLGILRLPGGARADARRSRAE